MTKPNWPMSEAEWTDTKRDITRLTGQDFMKMDVHRPPTDDEIDTTQAVDKTIGAGEEELRDAESVDSPAARCPTCFGPMPCAAHANVEHLSIVTSHDIAPTTLLAAAHNADIEHVVIIGMTRSGKEYFASSVSDAAQAMYYAQRAIHKLNKMVDGESIDDDPEDAA